MIYDFHMNTKWVKRHQSCTMARQDITLWSFKYRQEYRHYDAFKWWVIGIFDIGSSMFFWSV